MGLAMGAIQHIKRYLSIVLLFGCGALAAQPIYPRVHHLHEATGLLEDDYNVFVHQDRRGFVWIASMKGVYRFDGRHLEHFPLNGDGDCDRTVTSKFFEASDGTILFTTGTCIYRYDPEAHHMNGIPYAAERDFEASIQAIHLDTAQNRLWLTNTTYTWCVDATTLDFTSPRFDGGFIRFLHLSTQDETTQFLGLPWLAGKGVEHWKITGDSLTRTVIDDPILSEATVSGGLVAHPSSVWLYSDLGLLHYTGSGRPVVAYAPAHRTDPTVASGAPVGPDQLLLSLPGAGLQLFSLRTGAFGETIRADPDDLAGLQSDRVPVLTSTTDHWLWAMQTGRGLDYFQLPPARPEVLAPLPPEGEYVDAVLDEDGQLLTLTRSGEIAALDLRTGRITDRSRPYEQGKNASAVFRDATDRIWVIAERRVLRTAPGDLNPTPFGDSLPPTVIFDQIVQSPRGIAYASGSGIQSFQESGIGTSVLHRDRDDLLTSRLYAVGDRQFGVSTNGNRIDIYTASDSGFTKRSEVVLDAQVQGISMDASSSELLIATSTGIAYALSVDTQQVDSGFRLTDRKVREKAFDGVHIDRAGNRWAMSGPLIGIERAGVWHFTELLGRSPRSAFAKTIHSLPDGPGVAVLRRRGIALVTPEQVMSSGGGPPVYIAEAAVDDRRLSAGAAFRLENVVLPRQQSRLELLTRSLGDFALGDQRFAYRIAEHRDEWVEYRAGEPVVVSGLSPGVYTLELRATDNAARTGPIRKISISVRPPIYERLWFWVLLVALIGGLVFALTSYSYRRKLLRERRAAERLRLIERERDRIASELHDELGSELSSIRFLSEDIAAELGGRRAQRVAHLSQRAIEQMRDIIWALNSEEGTVEHLDERCREMVEGHLEQHQLKGCYRSALSGNEQKLVASEVKRNVFLILRELLHNIFKHAEATRVDVKVEVDGSSWKMSVADDGRGYSPKTSAGKGYGLQNIERRAAQVGGSIEVDSGMRQGTCTTLWVPQVGT